MEALSYKTLKDINFTGYYLENAPERVLQFGEGNFLRAFANYWFDMANETAGWNGKCVLVQPIPYGLTREINHQQGLYTLYLRGRQNGEPVDKKRLISSVSRCLNPYEAEDYGAMMELAVSDTLEYIVSNTTEAGISYDPACRLDDRPPASFPAKLTQVLYARYQAGKKGLVILSCELIDNNGRELRRCVDQHIAQWRLEEGFTAWLDKECLFCSTLVDRIVTGRINNPSETSALEEENGYRDALIDVGEVFGVWNIEGPAWLEEKLPFRAAGLNCIVVPDITPYKKRKVRILNGAHTGVVLGAYLAGYDIVRESMNDEIIKSFMNKMLYEEIIPTLPLEKKDLENFAGAVADRFDNPFIRHELMSIALNSISKWRARNLPSLLEYIELTGELPPCLATGFAACLAFYSSDIQELNEKGLVCRRPRGDCYTVSDDRWALEFFYDHRDASPAELVSAAMGNERMWGRDLGHVPGFEAAAVRALTLIREEGAIAAYRACL